MCRQKLGQSSAEEVCSDEDRNTPEPSQESHSPAVVRYGSMCDVLLVIHFFCSRLSAELQASRSSRSSPSYHRLRPIMRSRERRAMMERWGALSGAGEVPEELVDQVILHVVNILFHYYLIRQ